MASNVIALASTGVDGSVEAAHLRSVPMAGDKVSMGAGPRRGEATRAAILQAACVEFCSKGFLGGSMRSIARAAGVELAHVQHHFGDKNSLWRGVLKEVFGGVRDMIDGVYRDHQHLPPHEALSVLLDALIRYAASHPRFVELISQARTLPSADYARMFQVQLGPGIRVFVDLIAAAQVQGRFADGDPLILFYQFVGAGMRVLTAAADAEALGRSVTDPETLDEHIRTCIAVFARHPKPDDARHEAPDMERRLDDVPSSLLIGQVDNIIGKGLNDALRETQLTRSQMAAFLRIAEAPDISSAGLAKRLDVTPQSVMVFVKALEARGIIQRQQSKRSKRVQTLELTPAGRAMVARLRALIAATEHAAFSALSPEERAQFQRLLQRVLWHRSSGALPRAGPETPD